MCGTCCRFEGFGPHEQDLLWQAAVGATCSAVSERNLRGWVPPAAHPRGPPCCQGGWLCRCGCVASFGPAMPGSSRAASAAVPPGPPIPSSLIIINDQLTVINEHMTSPEARCAGSYLSAEDRLSLIPDLKSPCTTMMPSLVCMTTTLHVCIGPGGCAVQMGGSPISQVPCRVVRVARGLRSCEEACSRRRLTRSPASGRCRREDMQQLVGKGVMLFKHN